MLLLSWQLWQVAGNRRQLCVEGRVIPRMLLKPGSKKSLGDHVISNVKFAAGELIAVPRPVAAPMIPM